MGALDGTVVEVCVAHDFRPVEPARFSRVFCQRARGLIGMEIGYRGEVFRIAPTRMVAANRSFRRVLEGFLEPRGANIDEFAAEGSLRAFSARQYLLSGGDQAGVTELFRGAPLVEPTASIDRDRAAHLAGDIGRWMLRNLSADGELPYKYWPSRGAESPADNAIRRFLASLSLARLGELRGDAEIREAARRNLCLSRNIGSGRRAIVERTGAPVASHRRAAVKTMKTRTSFTTSCADEARRASRADRSCV